MTAADKGVGLPAGPVIAGVDLASFVQGSPLSMLNNAVEPFVPLAVFTHRLEEILKLRRARQELVREKVLPGGALRCRESSEEPGNR